MRLRLWGVALLFLSINRDGAFGHRPTPRSYTTHDYYVLVHDPSGGATLDDCASTLGLELVEQAGELQNHWLLRVQRSHSLPGASDEDAILTRLNVFRSAAADIGLHSRHLNKRVGLSVKDLSKQVLRQRVKRAPPPIRPSSEPNVTAEGIASHFGISDPLFTKQWHLVNDENPGNMLNVAPVWDMGITGEGVITSLVDDGLDFESNDLADNFDAWDSHDFNDHVPLPKPMLSDDHHGTRCAGQIAAVKNEVCGVGVAYASKVAGVRILSGPISDVDEAAALNFGFQNVSIYSCSWGPPDDGRSMEAPGLLIHKAVVNGVQNGRGGKGSIFVFASGNGASSFDQCNFDGYTNSIYSVTVAALDHKGMHPPYSEACAANMIVAYSSGGGKSITTTDVGKDKCSSAHGGTSAAAPNAAGVIALALEARPDLTWRDVQHLCVNTALKINADDEDWEKTASGNLFSYKYGYGAIDAFAFVQAAQSWNLVKPQAWLSTPAVVINDGFMDHHDNMTGGELLSSVGVRSEITVTKQMMADANLGTLEHVTVTVWISHTKRGDVEVELLSPNGIRSVLAAKRQFDRDRDGFPGWTFMSIKHWNENPVGQWTIRVSDQGMEDHSGYFLGWTMNFFGSTIDPSKARPYLVPSQNRTFPPLGEYGTPLETSSASIQPSSTKQHAKPTDHLPTDHPGAEGDKSKPTFASATPTADGMVDVAEPSGSPLDGGPMVTMTPTPDEGWFPDMSALVKDQKWVIGSVVIVGLFGLGVGGFFWRRRRQQLLRQNYGLVASGDDDMAMSSLGGDHSRLLAREGPRTKELYDAFGELSDDEDADEETELRPSTYNPSSSAEGARYHSGFLDGDGAAYKDEPDLVPSRGSGEDSGSGSADGSWEHASQTR